MSQFRTVNLWENCVQLVLWTVTFLGKYRKIQVHFTQGKTCRPLCSGLKLADSRAEISPRPFLALALLIKLFKDSPINCLMPHFQLKEQWDLHMEPKSSSFVYLPKDIDNTVVL